MAPNTTNAYISADRGAAVQPWMHIFEAENGSPLGSLTSAFPQNPQWLGFNRHALHHCSLVQNAVAITDGLWIQEVHICKRAGTIHETNCSRCVCDGTDRFAFIHVQAPCLLQATGNEQPRSGPSTVSTLASILWHAWLVTVFMHVNPTYAL